MKYKEVFQVLHILILFLSLFLNSRVLAVNNKKLPAVANLLNESQYAVCNKHQFKWMDQSTFKQLSSQKNLKKPLQKVLTCDPQSQTQIVSDSLKNSLDQVILKQMQDQVQKKILEQGSYTQAQTQTYLNCFESAKGSQDPACQKFKNEELKSLHENLKLARAFKILSQPPEPLKNKSGAYKNPLTWIPQKIKLDIPAATNEEIKTAEKILKLESQEQTQIQDLEQKLSEGSYQEFPESAKNLAFHDQVPQLVQKVGENFELRCQNILSQNPVLKLLLSEADPTKNYELSDSQLKKAYSTLAQQQKTALEKLKNEKINLCEYNHTQAFNQILTQNVESQKPANLTYCRLAESLEQECQSKEQNKALVAVAGLTTTCVFTSPVVCGLVGVSLTGKDLISQKNRVDQVNAEQSAQIQSYTEVVKQQTELSHQMIMAPAAILDFPLGKAMSSNGLKALVKKAQQNGWQNTQEFSKKISQWNQKSPRTLLGVQKIMNGVEEKLKNFRAGADLKKRQLAVDESIQEILEQNQSFKNKSSIFKKEKVEFVKSCLSLKKGSHAP
jgi:hypothetical protein